MAYNPNGEILDIPTKKEMEDYWKSSDTGKYVGYGDRFKGLYDIEACHEEIEELDSNLEESYAELEEYRNANVELEEANDSLREENSDYYRLLDSVESDISDIRSRLRKEGLGYVD